MRLFCASSPESLVSAIDSFASVTHLLSHQRCAVATMGFSLKYVVAFDKQSHEDARRDLDAMHSSARLVDIGEQALLIATARERNIHLVPTKISFAPQLPAHSERMLVKVDNAPHQSRCNN